MEAVNKVTVKNKLGVSIAMDARSFPKKLPGTFCGSSLSRKPSKPSPKPKLKELAENIIKHNVLSLRSKAKIRTKILALTGYTNG
jgi:hypothetical protein